MEIYNRNFRDQKYYCMGGDDKRNLLLHMNRGLLLEGYVVIPDYRAIRFVFVPLYKD